MTQKYKPKVPKLLKTWPYRIGYALAIVLIIFGTLYFKGGHSKAITDTFTTSGTWNVPANVFSATFEAWGGGGAGGGTSANGSGGSGGAGGQYAVKNSLTVNSGDAYTVTVATTVAGGTAAGTVGNDSQVANPASTVFLRAKGGAGGGANTAAAGTGSTTNGVGDAVNAGGNGAVGTATLGGGGGGGAGSTGGGGNASGTTAGTGTSTNGGNGGTGVTTSLVGNPGNNYGGGGSGAFKSSGVSKAGGGGAQGFVTVTYTVTPPSYTQADYRLFANADSTTPGSTLAAQDTGATLTSTGQQFRLRQLVKSNVAIPSQSTYAKTAVTTSSGGSNTSVAVGNDGFARISSYSSGLRFTQCTNSSCSTKNTNVIDPTGAGIVGDNSAVAIGSDGLARLVYNNNTTGNLVLRQCSNDACTSSTAVTNIYSGSGTDEGISVVLGSDGFARISFYDQANSRYEYMRCLSDSCSTHTTASSFDTVANISNTTSLVLGTDGFARISYYDGTNRNLKYVRCTNADCSAGNFTLTTVDNSANDVGTSSSIALGSDGFARISYIDFTNSNLLFVRCTADDCSTHSTPVNIGNTAASSPADSITLGGGSLANIGFYDSTNEVKLVQCANNDCTSSSTVTVDSGSGSNVGQQLRMNLGSDGALRFSYIDNTNGNLDFAFVNQQFKLQFGAKGSACSTASYSDVTSSSAISFNNNSTPADGAAITYQSGTDPTDSGQTVTAQTYQESNSVIGPNAWGNTADAEWDFSLADNGASGNTAYCFRLVQGDGTALTTYTNYPVITTVNPNSAPAAPTLSTPASGATGVSPNTQFTLRTTDTNNDFLDYRLYIYQSDCSTAVSGSPFTQLSLQAGWTGQDANSGAAYVGSSTLTSSTIATYKVQTPLSYNTTYCWKADATDPAGTNTYSPASTTQLFTTLVSSPTSIHGNVNIRGNTTIH